MDFVDFEKVKAHIESCAAGAIVPVDPEGQAPSPAGGLGEGASPHSSCRQRLR